ncbi:MAG: TonB-dependent receptor, partial [Opitutales bacterium]|nr:TonB-dependent receptor [Opitutales bacterium]
NGRIGVTTSDYSRRTIDDLDGKDTFGMSITADYQATEKLSTALTLNRDFELGSAAEGILATGATLSANYRIDDFWSANASLGYRLDDYQYGGREDDIYKMAVGASYAINEWASAYANYSLAIDESNQEGMDYTNNIVTVGVSLRY